MNTEIDNLIDGFTNGRITRRQLIAALFGLVAMTAGSKVALGETPQNNSSSPFHATALDHIALPQVRYFES